MEEEFDIDDADNRDEELDDHSTTREADEDDKDNADEYPTARFRHSNNRRFFRSSLNFDLKA